MIHQPKPESIIEELHRIRREISDRFAGNIVAIAKDAADRLAASGRPIWQPQGERAVPSGTGDGNRPTTSSPAVRR